MCGERGLEGPRSLERCVWVGGVGVQGRVWI